MEAVRADMEREKERAKVENQRLKALVQENRRAMAAEQENVNPEFNQQVKELREGLLQTEAQVKSEISGKNSAVRQFEGLETQLVKQRQHLERALFDSEHERKVLQDKFNSVEQELDE